MIEVPPVAFLPNSWVDKQVLVPMKAATNGSLIASEKALEYGWAINLAGGYHHASAEDGGGFCIFADISLIIANMRRKYGGRKLTQASNTSTKTTNYNNKTQENKESKEDESKMSIDDDSKENFMIIDLDAHQGNGHENDKVNGIYNKYGANVFIFDVYNQWIYPGDSYAKGGINKAGHIRVNSNIGDAEYIKHLKENLAPALDQHKPVWLK